jgi:hypothetical protein
MSGMIYDLAVVEDRGPYWRVVNVQQNTLDNQATTEERVLRLSYMTGRLMTEALLAGKAVHIPKSTLRTTEVLPGDFTVIDLAETDELQEARNAAIIKVRMLVTPEISKISGFALYGFIILNNDLSANGYFITNENREEKYLEILETGDEKLIQKLEDYLNYKDEIEAIAQLERKFSAFRSEIKTAATVEEVQEIEARFLERFYASY